MNGDFKMKENISRKEREFLTRRADILSAAEKVFAARGFYGSTMDEIAKRAEFGTGSLYKYFRGKNDLYFSLIDEKVAEITRLVRAELDKDLPPLERIASALDLQLAFIQRNRDFFKIYISEWNRFEWTIKDDLGKGVHEKFMAYIDSLFLRLRVAHEPEGVFLGFKGTHDHEHLLWGCSRFEGEEVTSW
jgi:AcrR family transcriptional regulator